MHIDTKNSARFTQPFAASLLAVAIVAILTGCKADEANENETAANTTQNNTTTTEQKPAEPQQQTDSGSEAEAIAVTASRIIQQDSYVTASESDVSQGASSPAKPSYRSELSRKKVKQGPAFSEMAYGYAPPPAPQTLDYYGDQPNRENYHQDDINPVHQAAQNPVSTFSVDVDTASYSNVRRMLNFGQWPQKGAVRVEEMINYFQYDYPTPDSTEQPFAIHTEVATSPWDENKHLMRVALKGYEVEKTELPPMNLVFLFDVSGSMNDPQKLPLLKQAFSLLTKQLRPQDKVSMVVYAGASGLVLEPTAGDKQADILAALEKLQAGGSTNGGAGIQLAYNTAMQHFKKDGINRVILATDGDFNVGMHSHEGLKNLVEEKKNSGVFLSILGFGQGNYNDHLMEELSNLGNGNAFYIDSFNEARKVLSDGLTGTLQTIAKDVKIQVEFNPAHVREYRLIGYDNRQLKREDFNNDKVDAGDIGAGHSVTALYELVLKDAKGGFTDKLRYSQTQDADGAGNGELAYVKLRYKKPDGETSRLIERAIKTDQIQKDFSKTGSEFQFATAVAAFAERLRGGQYVNWSLASIRELAQANLGKDTWGYRHEFVQLTRNADVIAEAKPHKSN